MTIQARMRKEAEEQADALSTVRSWMGDIAKKDQDLQNRQSNRSTRLESNSSSEVKKGKTETSVTQGESAAKHT